MNNTSEWTVATVKVFSVTPHPNADKLDLVTVGVDTEWSYVVVHGKGLLAPGDLVTYVSVGSLVPMSDIRWSFLKPRAEGKSHYRIRAMSLRGVKSQGILTDYVRGTKPGDDVAEQLKIEKYLNPDEEVKLPTLPKRYGFFRRLLKQLFKSQNEKLDELIPEYGVTNLRKVPLFTEGDKVLYTEKLHGTNIRFGMVKGKLVVGSHRRIVSDNRNWLDKFLRRGAPSGGFYKENLWVDTVQTHVNLCELEDGVIYYGEIIGKTRGGKDIQPGFNYGYDKPTLRIFPSAYSLKTKRWQFVDLRIAPFVPSYPVSTFSQDYLENLAENNRFGEGTPTNMLEGIVVHSTDFPGIAGKWVSFRYKEL